jgi:hypothetical protein
VSTAIYKDADDRRLTIGVGCELVVEVGAIVKGLIQPSGALGFKLAQGEVTLDGSNPTSITTGLATIVAATASLKTATAPADDPSWTSVDYGGAVPAGRLDVHAWKNTGGTDPTLIASTNSTAVLSWIAIGT